MSNNNKSQAKPATKPAIKPAAASADQGTDQIVAEWYISEDLHGAIYSDGSEAQTDHNNDIDP